MLSGEIEHVAVDEEEDVALRVVDAHPHGVALPAVLAEGDGGDAVEAAGDVDRAVGRAVADDDDLVDQTAGGQGGQNLGEGLLFVVGGDDGRDQKRSPERLIRLRRRGVATGGPYHARGTTMKTRLLAAGF